MAYLEMASNEWNRGRRMEEINNYDWLELIPVGWKEIAHKMIEECEAIYPDWEIIDLKEKYGALRCYDDGVPTPLRDKIDTILDKYEAMSGRTCCRCGNPATKISTGWILPWCDFCGQDDEKYYRRIV